MKVLYFHQHFSTPCGAIGTRSYEMAQKLLLGGHQVTMVCGSYGAAETGLDTPFIKGVRRGRVDGIDVIEFELPYSNYDSFLKRAWIFLRFAFQSSIIALTYDYDLLFATSTPLTAGIPGIVGRFFRRKPFIFEVRDLWPELPREMGVITNPFVLQAMDLLEWLTYHFANACIGLSPGIVDGIKRRGVDLKKVAMIPNGCDLELFDPDKSKPIRPAGVKENDFVVIFTGAHGIANGLDAVLNAALELKNRRREDIKIVFIGDGKLKPELKRLARLGQLENCIFLDPVPKRELAQLLQGVDAGMMILANVPAFYYGTSPNKFFDYIAAGLPVLNNYPGWLSDIITENKCGIVVPPENPDAFADAMEYLADQTEKVYEMGKNSLSLARRSFDRRKLADEFADCLEKIGR